MQIYSLQELLKQYTDYRIRIKRNTLWYSCCRFVVKSQIMMGITGHSLKALHNTSKYRRKQ